MFNTIIDFLDEVPNPIPANSVPYFDGCKWKLIKMPESIDCDSLLACFDSAVITSFLSSSNQSILINNNGNLDVNPNWIATNIPSSWSSPILTIWDQSYDLSTLFQTNVYWTLQDSNWVNTVINNQWVLNIAWVDWMRFEIDTDVHSSTYNHLIVWLPTEALVPAPYTWALIPGPRQHWQVLTWDEARQVAYWANNNCCAQTLEYDPETETLFISWWNSVYLWWIDNQNLSLSWNLLSIENGNTVDLSNVNNHTLSISWDQLSVINSDWTHTSTVTLPTFTCDDVMACAWIQSIISQLNTLASQVSALESEVQNLWDAINGN